MTSPFRTLMRLRVLKTNPPSTVYIGTALLNLMITLETENDPGALNIFRGTRLLMVSSRQNCLYVSSAVFQ
jgi:hypothetical protein